MTISPSRRTSTASPHSTEFEALARLADLRFAGELPQKKYTRFMLIGSV